MNKKQISLIIPTLNEEGNIQKLLQRIDAALKASDIEYEVIFIDDHSKDDTVKEISTYSSLYPISCYLKKGNRGKGYSIVEGFNYVKYPLTGIIDADLQYPPEAIPEMVQQIVNGQADFVVANRNEKHLSFIRKFFSKGFKFFFGKLLHGFDFDIQAGLKVFKTQIIREVTINPQPWAWDLELVLGASDAGYSFGSVGVEFADREIGESKLNLIKAIREIGWNAIKMKFRKRRPFIVEATGPGMIGAGIAFKGKRFITHTDLDYKIGALHTFIPSQKFFIAFLVAIFGVGLYFSWLTTAIITMGILSSIYFLDALFNLVLVLRSLNNPPEINFNRRELAAINDADLPVFTVLCPLFRESRVLPGFIENISKVDWPKEKLDVMLLLEEADKETIQAAEAMNLPSFVRTVIVPKSMPQTKPKACNYGLSMARGEYLVIYDAEDNPETTQLKKAYLGFQVLPKSVKCLQAKLNYFNPSQNLLTRLFTAEYSLWFDVVLPGLQSLNTSIPLGGTSNFFRVADLRELKGWDPFNVTEDADLGTRLFTLGAKTAIIDSVTLEEANSNLKNWIRQRSRWIKGYMQTYLVHMRRPFHFWRKSGHHFFLFQLNVGGKIAFMLINPILWLATFSYFALNAIVGPTIESIYPTVILYMAATSLVFGNFLYFYYYMIGCAKRGHWAVIKYIFFIPFYWFFMSIAALMALYELIVRPHYWQKTNHGLHLAKKPEAQPSVSEATEVLTEKKVSETVLSPAATIEKVIEKGPVTQDNKLLSRGSVLIVAMMASNFINFVFNAFLGRKLDLEDLGLVTLINTLWYVASIFIGGVSATINHRTAYLSAKEGAWASINFWKVTLRLAIMTALFVSVVWMVAIPFLSEFFHINDRTVLLIFTPAITLGVLASANRGFLQGSLMFQATAIVFVVEALTKLIASVFLVHYNLHGWVFAVIPFSIFTSAILAWYLSIRVAGSSEAATAQSHQYEFPKFFYAASIMSSISSAIFLSLDIILVKHYLLPSQAGEYALLALVGKMIYFLGSLPAVFMLTFVSRAEGLGKSPKSTFNAIFGVTLVMVAVGFVSLGIFGKELVPVLLGEKTLAILEHLKIYTFAIALFTLANVIVSYHLARKQYLFPIASLITSAVMAVGIILSHNSIGDIVSVIISSSIFGLGLMIVMHVFENGVRYATTNLVDFFDAFIKKTIIEKPIGGQRVLVFNWRDTKHVYAGGAEVYIHEIAKRMVHQGDYVTVFCGNDGKSPRNEVIDGVNIIRRGGFAFVYLWAFVYYFTQFRGQYDVIIDCHNGIPFFTPAYVKEPVVCVVHHIHQEVFKRSLPIGFAQFACFLERDIMALVYKNKYFVTVSESSKEEMVQYGIIGKGIEIVHNGVDLKTFRPSEKSALPMVLYLGRLKAYKSIDILIAAFKLIAAKVPDIFLVIAGRGEEENHLKRLVSQLELEGKVIFTGKVSEEDKIDLLQKAWVMVNPSFMEGWGITTIEANACGTPVIGSDVHGLRDSIQDDETGYLVPHGDTKGFANRITAIIEDRRLRKEMSEKSLAWAQNFSWEKSVKKLSSIVFSIK